MSNFDVSIKASFLNQMGAGTRAAARDLKGVADAAASIGSRSGQRDALERWIKGTARDATQLKDRLREVNREASSLGQRIDKLGALSAGIGAGVATLKKTLTAPALAEADFGDIIIDIAQKANLSKDKVSGLADEVKLLADRLQSSPAAIGKGIDVLMGAGLDLDLSRRLIEPIQKVAKAYKTETGQVSDTVFAMANRFNVPAEKIEIGLGRLSQAAADGRFEMRNFASAIPNLAPIMKGLGQTGLSGVSRIAAAAEVVAGSVGDPHAAETALSDFLEKLQSPDVTKNFKDKGINIRKLVGDAKKSGGDIFETAYAALMKATKGDTSKVVDLFGDKEARRAAVALMQGMDDYRKMRDRYDKISSPDKLNSDLEMRLEGSGATFRKYSDRWDALMTSLGNGVNTYVKPAVDGFTSLLDVTSRLADTMPRLAGGIVLVGASLASVVAAKTAFGVLGSLLGRGGAAAATGAGAAAVGAASAPAAVAASSGPGVLGSLLARLATSPSLAGGAVLGLGWLGSKALEAAFNPRPWTVKDREDGSAQLEDLRAQRAEVAQRIADIQSKSKVPEMAESLSAPLKTRLADLDNQIRTIEEEMRKLDALTATPKIDTGPIERATELMRGLNNAVRGVGGGASFMDNAAPSGPKSSGGKQSAAPGNRTYNVSGYSPGAIARRIAREERRAVQDASYGALHDLGSLA